MLCYVDPISYVKNVFFFRKNTNHAISNYLRGQGEKNVKNLLKN